MERIKDIFKNKQQLSYNRIEITLPQFNRVLKLMKRKHKKHYRYGIESDKIKFFLIVYDEKSLIFVKKNAKI